MRVDARDGEAEYDDDNGGNNDDDDDKNGGFSIEFGGVGTASEET